MARPKPFAIGQFFLESGAPARPLQVTALDQDAIGLDRVCFRRPDGTVLAVWTEQAELAVSVGHLIPVAATAQPHARVA